MANDARLEQLKIAQDRAFTKKQEVYQKQQNSWERLSDARDKMNRAFDAKQSAFEAQERAWQEYRSVSDGYGPRIEYLKFVQETAYQNMKNAFGRASSAHDSHSGAFAMMYADEGHGYQAEAKGYVEERRRLVDECRSSKARHKPYKSIFEDAKIAFGRAKDEQEQAKAAHERANDEFKRSKTDFDAAAKSFQSRLAELKSEYSKKKENNRAIANKAGVPYKYRDNVYVSEASNGTVNIYFGGAGEPAGPGHGHYALNSNGDAVYKREPWDQHGPQNFRRDPSLQQRLATIALNSQQRSHDYAQSNTGPRMVQYNDIFVKVEVSSGYSIMWNKIVSDFLVYDKSVKHEHLHIIMDDDGRELFAEWRPNH